VRIAIVGITGAVGLELASQCDVDPNIELIVGVDSEAPRPVPEKLAFCRGTAGRGCEAAFEEHKVDRAMYLVPFAVGHSATDEDPDGEALKRFLQACAVTKVKSVVVANGFWAYGRTESGEPWAREGTPLAGGQTGHGSADLARERLVATFAREHPDVAVTLCRLAVVTGPKTSGLGDLLVKVNKVVALAGGPTPRFQFLHEEDAGLLLFKVLKAKLGGIFNLAPDDELDLMDLGRCLKKPISRMSPRMLKAVAGPGRFLGLDRLSGVCEPLLPLLGSTVVMTNKKVCRDVGYRFKYASDGALADAFAASAGAA
jgi:UDP-glucose 4-epimerase